MEIKALPNVSPMKSAAPVSEAQPTRETAGAPERESSSAVMPAFLSPVFRYDNAAQVAIMAFRDGNTGEVTQQFPPERIVAEYRRVGGQGDSAKPATSESSQGGRGGSPVPAVAPAEGTGPGPAQGRDPSGGADFTVGAKVNSGPVLPGGPALPGARPGGSTGQRPGAGGESGPGGDFGGATGAVGVSGGGSGGGGPRLVSLSV